ncbi:MULTISPECIES: 2-dehydropantoate 2-reductase [unclassified Caulobacter]|uniref:2-dehydropantoate 2-reductase n=1 Tax=unclassified Caulobacter TaxID=2648921 RepID=UPI000D3D9D50|nr:MULTISPECIES: 2-dehydropantoate 2-reductase [unclassified Caulobacter]PTS83861.1 2-dehydropantoate 2-reductase [Caulobacter sp. HMWF009]PTT08367.1 2-dehydropantoate 2-reductase [Caulobacter sp. HMWF025]
MTTIALIGPGAVGGTIAAWLAQNPALSVTVCARKPFAGLEIQTPGGPIIADPAVLTDAAAATPVDWVLIATKAYDTASAGAWLDALVGPQTRLVVLRNGVEHVEPFLDRLPVARIVPAVVDIPAERDAPGRIRQRRDGWIKVPDDAAGRAFVALLAHTPIAAEAVADFKTAAWRKLALNCAGAVNALILQPSGIAQDDGAAAVMRSLVAECVAVGRAEGADLPDSLADEVIDGYRSAAPDGINSLHADRLAGRPMELDVRNGVIVRRGAAHGIATPANAMVVALIQAATRP